MAHPVFEHPATAQVWLDKAGISEIRLLDNRPITYEWRCSLVGAAESVRALGRGDNAVKALLNALLKLKKQLDLQAEKGDDNAE